MVNVRGARFENKNKKLSVKQRCNNKKVCQTLFKLNIFQEKVLDWVKLGVSEINKSKYSKAGFLSKYKIEQVNLYVEVCPVALPGIANPNRAVLEGLAESSMEKTGLAVKKVFSLNANLDPDLDRENFRLLVEQVKNDPDGQVKVLLKGFITVLQAINTLGARLEKQEGKLDQYNQSVEKEVKVLIEKLEEMRAERDAMDEKMSMLEKELTEIQTERNKKADARAKRQNRKQKVSLTATNLNFILLFLRDTEIQRHSFEVCRIRLCVVLLFLTGLRVSDLRQFKLKDLSLIFGRKRKNRKILTVFYLFTFQNKRRDIIYLYLVMVCA